MSETTSPASKTPHWRRAIRPLIWWFIMVLLMFAYRTHERLSANTRISFDPTLAGKQLGYEASTTIDGMRASSGQRIPIGWHTLTITHPKTKSFSTNLFVGYGQHELGQIELERAMGTLEVNSDPVARRLTIRGPEFSATLTNTSGMTSSVPTGMYVIEGVFKHASRRVEVTVNVGERTVQNFAAMFGAIRIETSREDVMFQLRDTGDKLVGAGKLPAFVGELPVGKYRLIATRLSTQQEIQIILTSGVTNQTRVVFEYGTAMLATEPAGATVTSEDGRNWGETPLTLNELATGRWTFKLQRNGYESALVALEITANQTATYTTNLNDLNYAALIKTAKRELASKNYELASSAINEVLISKPGDAVALAMQPEAVGNWRIQTAKAKAKVRDFSGGIRDLTLALEIMPNNPEALRLMDEFKKKESDQIKLIGQEILARPKQAFEEVIQKWRADASPYEVHERTVQLGFQETQRALSSAFGTVPPVFFTSQYESKFPDSFAFGAYQQIPGGGRRCVFGGSQIDGVTKFYFKIVEYKDSVALNPTFVNLTDQQKLQIKEGIQTVTERVRVALEQAQGRKP